MDDVTPSEFHIDSGVLCIESRSKRCSRKMITSSCFSFIITSFDLATCDVPRESTGGDDDVMIFLDSYYTHLAALACMYIFINK